LSEEEQTTARAGWEEFYIPTHRGETAMDGAPELLGLGKREQATAKTKCGGLSAPQLTMKL
jgi:hypothetical protein